MDPTFSASWAHYQNMMRCPTEMDILDDTVVCIKKMDEPIKHKPPLLSELWFWSWAAVQSNWGSSNHPSLPRCEWKELGTQKIRFCWVWWHLIPTVSMRVTASMRVMWVIGSWALFFSVFLSHVFGAGHLRGSRLLLFFAFYYENNIVGGGWVGWGGGGVGSGGVGWDNNVISTATHMWCNISVRSPAFLSHPHVRHATLLQILLHFHTYVMLRCRCSCTSTHTSCYAAVGSLALPHIRHATL